MLRYLYKKDPTGHSGREAVLQWYDLEEMKWKDVKTLDEKDLDVQCDGPEMLGDDVY